MSPTRRSVATLCALCALLLISPWLRPTHWAREVPRAALRADDLLDAGEPDAALEQLDELATHRLPGFTEWLLRGYAELQRGDVAAAAVALDEARRARPGHPEVWFGECLLLHAQTRWAEADRVCGRVLELELESASVRCSSLLMSGLARLELGDAGGAQERFDSCLAKEPDNAVALHYASLVAAGRGDARAALDLIHTAQREDPDYVARWVRRDDPHYELLQGDATWTRFWDTQPPLPVMARADLEGSTSPYRYWMQPTRRQPAHYRDLESRRWDTYDRAEEAVDRGDPADAVAILDEAAQRVTEGYPELLLRSRALMSLGRMDESSLAMERAELLGPRVPYVWIERCITADDAGAYAEALRSCDRAVELQGEAPSCLALTNRALALIGLGRLDEAGVDVERCLAIEPADPEALWVRAAVRARVGDEVGAIADLREALSAGAGDDAPLSDPLLEPLRGTPAWGELEREFARQRLLEWGLRGGLAVLLLVAAALMWRARRGVR